MIVIMKKLGLKEYLADTWNLADILTLLLSFLAFALYIILKMSIIALQNQVSRTYVEWNSGAIMI